MLLKNKNIFFIVGAIIFCLLLAVFYANPILSEQRLIQPDIVHYKGGAKELLDYRAEYGKETYWSDAMFGGMPTYHTGAQFRGDIIKQIDNLLMFLPKPVNYLSLLFVGFFFLGMVVVRDWKYALLGALFFGFSTYFYIIIAAGHNGKVHTIAYFAPLLAGVLLVYIRRKYILGFIVTALFMGLQIAANHPQMTYYLFIGLGFLFISEFIRAVRGFTSWKHFGLSTSLLVLAFILGVGMNAQRLLTNSEYIKETVRGKQILDNDKHSSKKSGLDKESITMWSYGKVETLNLFIPRLLGGANQEEVSEQFKANVLATLQSQTDDEAEISRIYDIIINQYPKYWGEQPMTSGPAYQGAVVCFLAIFGFFFAHRRYRFWILGASILTIMLAWGHHFMPLTDFFIDYVPLYNKFRAPSSILVVVELLFPLIAILGVYRFFNDKKLTNEYKQKTLIYVGTIIIGLTLILIVLGRSLFDFYLPEERNMLPEFLLNLLKEERFNMMKTDAIKAIVYTSIAFVVLFLGLKKKLSQNIVLIILGIVSLIDLWSVNKRYLNETNFVDKTFADYPFQTESNEYLISKADDNPYIQGLLYQTNVNKVLQTLAEKDNGHYRIFNTTLGTFGETNTSYFKSSIGGYSAVKLRRYDDLINTYFTQQDSIKTPRILNMLNAKYFVVGEAQSPQTFPNPDANGNAWFVSEVQFVKSANEEIQTIGEVDNKRIAVVHQEDKGYFKGKQLAKDSTAFITLSRYKADEIELKTQSKTPQLAVMSEIYYPYGWKILIDGKEVPYIKANYLLRAVYVPAGQHTIKMVFEPKTIETGKIISIIMFGIFLVLSVFGIFLIFRKKELEIK